MLNKIDFDHVSENEYTKPEVTAPLSGKPRDLDKLWSIVTDQVRLTVLMKIMSFAALVLISCLIIMVCRLACQELDVLVDTLRIAKYSPLIQTVPVVAAPADHPLGPRILWAAKQYHLSTAADTLEACHTLLRDTTRRNMELYRGLLPLAATWPMRHADRCIALDFSFRHAGSLFEAETACAKLVSAHETSSR